MSWIVMQVNHRRWNEPIIAKYQVVIIIERIQDIHWQVVRIL